MRRTPLIVVVLVLLLGAAVGAGATTLKSSGGATNLPAVQAIEDTMTTYAYQLDSGTVDGLMAVFAPDATAYYSFPGGTFDLVGSQAIRDFLGPFTGTGGAHQLTDPLVDVHGTTATGQFYLWRVQPAGVSCSSPAASTGKVGWILGRYDMEFRWSRSEWVISKLHFVTQSTGTLDGCKFP